MAKQGKGRRMRLCWAVLMGLWSASVTASTPFYLIGDAAPVDVRDPDGARAVHLRWGVLEGDMPAEVQGFRLLRDGSELARFDAGVVLDAPTIAALYADPGQSPRAQQTLAALQRQATESGEPSFPASDFAARLRQRLLDDPIFRTFMPTQDINVARATSSGYIDFAAAGTHEYELLAFNAAGVERRVGLLQVDLSQQTALLPPLAFRQVLGEECDRLEAGKEDLTVALTWIPAGGDNPADVLASRLFLAGYDLYRTLQPLPAAATVAPARNLAAEIEQAPRSGDGQPRLNGLERVNDVVLTIDGSSEGAAVFIETRDQLAAAGLQPGERRAYYLVGRDFLGRYGSTLGAVVRVPDLARPPAPWDVRTYAETPDGDMTLNWSAIRPGAYQRTMQGTKKLCNPLEAAESGRYEFVGGDENCATDARRPLILEADDYVVYRFAAYGSSANTASGGPPPVTASTFSDADLDGYSDALERYEIAQGRLAPGAQCDAAQTPAGPSARADSVQVRNKVLPSGHVLVEMRDRVPAEDPGVVYWYRIASLAKNGRASLLSAPVRAIFPLRETPPEPVVEVVQSGTEDCGCALDVVDAQRPWRLRDSIGRASQISVRCNGNPLAAVDLSDIDEAGDPLCANPVLREACGPNVNVELEYVLQAANDKGGAESVCTVALPAEASLCRQGDVGLRTADCAPVPLPPGARTDEDADVIVRFPPGYCGSLLQNLPGVGTIKVASSCGTELPGEIRYPIQGRFCGSAVTQSSSNDLSAAVQIPCVEAGQDRFTQPTAPQPISVAYFAESVRVGWRLPAEPIAATLIELAREGGGPDGLLQRVIGGFEEAGAIREESLPFPAPLNASENERWCVRLQAIAPGSDDAAGVPSPWSAPLCRERIVDPAVALPEFLPWPPVPVPARQADRGLRLGGDVGDSALTLPLVDLADIDNLLSFCGVDVVKGGTQQPACNDAGRDRIRTALAGALPVLIYRQSRRDGIEGDWQAVSPLIERVHFSQLPVLSNDRDQLLDDPYITLYPLSPNDQWRLAFPDTFPRLIGTDYRYQIISLARTGAISGWAQTAWIAERDSSQGGTP